MQTSPSSATVAPRCNVELSADKSKYFETAQRLGADFSKLAKLPFSAGLENQVKNLVQDTFQAIPESSTRCMIVAKLQACAMEERNSELMLRMQETVDKVCAGGTATSSVSAKATTVASGRSPGQSPRMEQWKCIPPGRRGSGTDLQNTDPDRRQLSGGVLYWSTKADSEAIRCVELLLSSGADPNYSETEPAYEGFFGGPPLHLALSHSRWDMVDTLMRHGADPKRRSVWKQLSAAEIAQGYGAPESVMLAIHQAAQR